MTPDQKIQALKEELANLESEMGLTDTQDWVNDCQKRQDDTRRDIAILEKFQNKPPDLLPDMELLLRAAVKADQKACETAAAKLAESSGQLAELERLKQLLNS